MWGLGAWGIGCGVWSFGFDVRGFEGLRFRVWGLRFRGWGLWVWSLPENVPPLREQIHIRNLFF